MERRLNKSKTRRWLSVRRIGATSNRTQLILSFILFTFTATILLAGPLGWPIVCLVFPNTQVSGVAFVPLAISLAEWAICLSGLVLMGRLANSLSDNLRLIFTRYLLFALLIFLAVQRLADSAIGWLQAHRLAHAQQWIQVLSSMSVAIGAALLLPRLRGVRKDSAIGQKEHARFLVAAETTLDDFYIFDGIPDPSGRIVDFRFSYINPNAERRLNVQRESLLGRVLTEVRPFMISSGLIERYREVVRTGVPFVTEVFIDDDMIKATWLNVQVVKLGDGIAITSRDVTERRRLTDRINYLAHHDQLTGLANRTLLQDRLKQAIRRAQRHNQRVAIFVLDIDHFKRINDSLGHADGDSLLATFGRRLLASVRETDTVARIGGDEFVIVMSEFKSLDDVKHSGAKIIEGASRPITIGGREIRITVSAGVCIYPDCGLELDELLKNADTAMYMIKDSGRNGVQVFNEAAFEENPELLAEPMASRH
jgi:diguanylate cyclase (GGDEF)-like protein